MFSWLSLSLENGSDFLRRIPGKPIIKATPHRAGGADTQSDFSSDCIEMTPLGWRPARNFCARWRKRCKQMRRQAVRRALCGVALRILYLTAIIARWLEMSEMQAGQGEIQQGIILICFFLIIGLNVEFPLKIIYCPKRSDTRLTVFFCCKVKSTAFS